jgi:hypothetical protein
MEDPAKGEKTICTRIKKSWTIWDRKG